jgi:RNA polymerase sigma factor (sigma-70 family)
VTGVLDPQSARGDEYSFEFDRLHRCAYRAAARVLGPGEDARDVAQETLTRAYTKWSSLEGAPWTRAWVATVSRNLAIDSVRRRRSETLSIDLPERADDISSTLDRVEIDAALDSLSPRQREVLALRYLDDLSIEQVADTLGCSISAVKTYSTRGISRMRQRLLAAGMGVLLIACMLAAATLVRANKNDHAASRIIVVADTPLRVTLALSSNVVTSGAQVGATVEVQNTTNKTMHVSVGTACAPGPDVVLVPVNGTAPVAQTACTRVSPTVVELTAGATRDWAVTVHASANGVPLWPGQYQPAVRGINGRTLTMATVVTVVSTHKPVANPIGPAPAPGWSNPSSSSGSGGNALAPVVVGPNVPAAVVVPSSVPARTVIAPPATTPSDPYLGTPPPPSPPPGPTVLNVHVGFRNQSSSLSSTRALVNWTLSIRNMSRATFTDTFVADVVTVTTPDGQTHESTQEAFPKITIRAAGQQTVNRRFPVQLGAAPYVDGGVVNDPPQLGKYTFTYYFIDTAGARTPTTTFTLTVQ